MKVVKILKNAYTQKIEELYKKLKTQKGGLTLEEAAQRLARHGANVLEEKKRKTIFKMIVEQLTDKMIIILLLAALLSFILGERVEGLVILVIIIINTIISIIQEKKAADAVAALKNLNAPHAIVIRSNVAHTILTKELVVGDIVLLEAGSIVPADLRLIKDNALTIDESALTGESIPVVKDANLTLAEGIPLGDRLNMAYSSTIVTYGTGMGVVVATGMDTEVGKIAGMLEGTDDNDTPLKRKLGFVGTVLSIAGIIIAVIIFILGLLYGKDLTTILMIAISLAIAVIPEGLPATATIVMALGVERMAKKKALVKKLPAVETLGCASVICTDKTGTLTQNKMTVTTTLSAAELIVGKTAYEPKELLLASMLCNNATINNEEVGDPTELALLHYIKKENKSLLETRSDYQRILEWPFDSKRKRMSVLYNIEGVHTSITKGAPEELLELCSYILKNGEVVKLTVEDKKTILEKCSKLSSEALRLLGFAKKEFNYLPKEDENVETELVFLGLIGMIDPPRTDVVKSIQTFKDAGIKVVMITGDHKLTAIAIGKQLGIYTEGNIAMTGEELHALSDEQLTQMVKDVTIFARVAPEDKLRIVNAFKSNEEVVAMTGDGVNDSPALKAADIGVAMGKTGTDVAKGAADMLLLDDNFTTIEIAIREGRRVYRNIQKVIQFLLSGNIAEVLVVFLSTLFNISTPILAVHILFINLVTDTLPALGLGVDPEDEEEMKRKPVKDGSLFEKGLVIRVIFYSIIIASATLVAYFIGTKDNYVTGTTMAFLVLCLTQIVHALNQHSATISVFSKKHAKNKALYLAMLASTIILLAIIFIPPLASFFSLTTLSLKNWGIVIGLSLTPLVVLEIVKLIRQLAK